jgi:uncharacterized protein
MPLKPMPSNAIVDTGPLIAWADRDEEHHVACLDIFARPHLTFIIPTMVVAEVTSFLGRRLPAEWQRIAELVEQYAVFPLGGTDVSVIALAERLGTDLVVTLDRRRFGAVRPLHVQSLPLLPD